MANYKQLGIGLCLLATLPLTAVEGAAACSPPGENALKVGDYYEKTVQTPSGAYVEIWREANGAGGLQTARFSCADGTRWSPDFFVGSTPKDSTLSI